MRARDKGTGQFAYQNRWERLCRCGHQLGQHTAESPHTCIEADRHIDDPTWPGCACLKFRPARDRLISASEGAIVQARTRSNEGDGRK